MFIKVFAVVLACMLLAACLQVVPTTASALPQEETLPPETVAEQVTEATAEPVMETIPETAPVEYTEPAIQEAEQIPSLEDLF